MTTPAIDFKLQPARQHTAFLVLVTSLAILSAFTASLPILMRFLLSLAVFYYGVRLYHREVKQGHPRRILGFKHERGRIWMLTTPQGSVRVKMRPSVVVTRWVSILSFDALGAGAYTCMIFPDSLAPGQYRQFLTKF